MTTDAGHTRAAELLYPGLFIHDAVERHPQQIARVTAALAEARAEADKLRADILALADTLDAEARECARQAEQALFTGSHHRSGLLGRILGKKSAAARLRALAVGGPR